MSRTQSKARNVLLLFDRPAQPIFRPKGVDATMVFDIPTSYYDDRYRPIADSVTTRGPGVDLIPVQEHTMPDIKLAMSLDRRTHFTVFNDYHRDCAANLITALAGASNIDQFTAICCYAQQRVNPYLYIYALSVATLHRPDTRNLPIPSHACSFPELYVDSVTLSQARVQGTLVTNTASRTPLEIPRDYTASNLYVENRLAYFREDIGVNLHHWHWHLVYPLTGPQNIVSKDRRGEMFYYMHHQIIARYNFERFCNDLPRVVQYSNFREPIEEAYFPKLDTVVARYVYPPRSANFYLSNLNRESDQIKIDLADAERWRDRLYEAIHRGFVFRGNEQVPLGGLDGIDLLGNTVEANQLSVNRNLYGNLHNVGHTLISYCHDPDNRYLEPFGAIGDSSTAMRDPIFYRWHAFIDDIFDEYKSTLPPYSTELNFDGVQVSGIEVRSQNVTEANVLTSFWQNSQLDLSRGLDFASRGPVYASFTHLQHEPFTYTIRVQNSGTVRMGTVRIFLAPELNERGVTFLFRDQRLLFFELDKFTATLNSGLNTITRSSRASSVTIPYEQTFRSLEDRPETDFSPEQEDFNFCGCGWPDHMLIPRGTAGAGIAGQLFVMITDYQTDRVGTTDTPPARICDDAVSFCGLRNARYPDAKPMGFPFDRMARPGVVTLSQFLTPNMGVQRIRIRHENRTVVRASPSTTTATPTTASTIATTTGRT